jgi:hypothetical protein
MYQHGNTTEFTMQDIINVVSVSGKQLEIKVGTEIFLPSLRGRGGHGAYIVVDKINRRSFVGTEGKGSYKAGMEWKIHVDCVYAVIERTDIPGKYMINHWVNDV